MGEPGIPLASTGQRQRQAWPAKNGDPVCGRRDSVTTSSYPFVTVIIPIRNEARYLRRSLGSVLAQDYPGGRMEVLVVDGMSEDGTREMLSEMGFPVPGLSPPFDLLPRSHRAWVR